MEKHEKRLGGHPGYHKEGTSRDSEHYERAEMIIGRLFTDRFTELNVGLFSGLIRALGAALPFGLAVGLSRGGEAVIKHYALRLTLWLSGYMPFKFIDFLDQCDKLILLKKVGGGYIFIHRMLLEYFAELNPVQASATATVTQEGEKPLTS